jgi:DNA-binding response OmpR family regulator
MVSKEKKIKILLVEDDTFLLEMYSTKFNLEGFDVVAAADGEEGLKLAKKEKPDIVLLDVLMPKIDGFTVLKKLKKDSQTKAIPVVLLTNLGQKNDIDKGLKDGAEGYLIKAHFIPSEVVSKIKKILSKS